MMIDINAFLLIVTYILGCSLLIALTILTFRLMNTLNKVNRLLDDLTDKSSKLDGVFTLADRSADALNSIVGEVSSTISNFVMSIVRRKKERKEEDIDE